MTANPTPTATTRYEMVRSRTVSICQPLESEDYVVQPIAHVSPPKWHLGHTTWFFETFLLLEHLPNYKMYNPQFAFVFNSYYEGAGARVMQSNRGNLSRPTVKDTYAYRAYVDQHMVVLIEQHYSDSVAKVIEIGLAHEEQHQELLLTDIKYILGHNPLWPIYQEQRPAATLQQDQRITIDEGTYDIGHNGAGFHFDNERPRHRVYLGEFTIQQQLVTNCDYLAFINAGGYSDYQYWLSEGWQWVKDHAIKAPLYWYDIDGERQRYTLAGMKPIDLNEPVSHISYYEAEAYARWSGKRLPTEQEWEVASDQFSWGSRWEWTSSAYTPYPGYKPLEGTLGEYNGKFMVSQNVLRGASVATAPGHSRRTYRNFFHPWYRWQYTGIRLCVEK